MQSKLFRLFNKRFSRGAFTWRGFGGGTHPMVVEVQSNCMGLQYTGLEDIQFINWVVIISMQMPGIVHLWGSW